jgi:hypothetical protein
MNPRHPEYESPVITSLSAATLGKKYKAVENGRKLYNDVNNFYFRAIESRK